MSNAIVVLDGYALNPGDLTWDRLKTLGTLTVHDRTPRQQVVERCAGSPFVLTNKTPLDADAIAALPDLQYVGVLATGYNIVDIHAARRRNIPVTNVPTYSSDSVAQHAVSLMLELARHTSAHARAVADGRWAGSPDFCVAVAPIIELSGKTLGIFGLGRIGLALAKIAHAMGMRILAHSRRPDPPRQIDGIPVTYRGFDELFAESDVLSLHCPLTPQTERMVNAQRLRLMKPTAFLINTGRGQLIDNAALADALRNHVIAAAAIDVLEVEPPPADHPLLHAPRCLVTPHVAWCAREARQRLMESAADNLLAFQRGQPVNVVNPA